MCFQVFRYQRAYNGYYRNYSFITGFSDSDNEIYELEILVIGTIARHPFLYAQVPVMIPTDISIKIYM